jgi:hypothetical protein
MPPDNAPTPERQRLIEHAFPRAAGQANRWTMPRLMSSNRRRESVTAAAEVDQMMLMPDAEEPAIVLRGALAAILRFAANKKSPDLLSEDGALGELKMHFQKLLGYAAFAAVARARSFSRAAATKSSWPFVSARSHLDAGVRSSVRVDFATFDPPIFGRGFDDAHDDVVASDSGFLD